jgi:hypothetical protein
VLATCVVRVRCTREFEFFGCFLGGVILVVFVAGMREIGTVRVLPAFGTLAAAWRRDSGRLLAVVAMMLLFCHGVFWRAALVG